MPIHLKVREGDVAERVIAVGDPERARQVSSLLTDARPVNENRGFLTYTGYFNGVKVTVATHGVGAPSAAIVFEELIQAGARIIVRLGTAGALRPEVQLGTLIVPNGAGYNIGGIYSQYLGLNIAYPAVPSPRVYEALISELKASGLHFRVGPIYSSDAFYAEEDLPRLMGSRGILGVEMECAILFILGMLRGVETGAVLMVSNNLAEGRYGRYLTSEDLRDITLKAALATLRALSKLAI